MQIDTHLYSLPHEWQQLKKLYLTRINFDKDTGFFGVGEGSTVGAGHVAVEGHFQGVAVGIIIQTAPQSPETQHHKS